MDQQALRVVNFLYIAPLAFYAFDRANYPFELFAHMVFGTLLSFAFFGSGVRRVEPVIALQPRGPRCWHDEPVADRTIQAPSGRRRPAHRALSTAMPQSSATSRQCAVRRREPKEVQDLLAGLSQQPGRS